MLRDYQVEAVRTAVHFFSLKEAAPSLMVLPTAWGKSWLTAYVAKSIGDGDRLLVVQPNKELLEQNYEKYVTLCGGIVDAGIFSASFNKKEIKKITYATIGSIKELGAMFRERGFTKLLIDEAHLYPRREESMIGMFLSDSGIGHVLGITATPLKLETVSSQRLVQKKDERGYLMKKADGEPLMVKVYDGYSKLVFLTSLSQYGGFYKDIIYSAPISDMTAGGYWCRLRYDVQPFEPKALRLNGGAGEYSEKSTKTAYELNNVHDRILGALKYYSDRKRCLVFTPGIREAEELAAACPDGAAICGKTPKKERKRLLDAFRRGDIRVLFNALLLTTGFDCPEIDCIILGSATASVTKYYQTCGRGVRVAPGKKDCIIVDMCGNVRRFGRVGDIVYRKETTWRMYGSGGKLLSGIPIECVGCYDEQDVRRMESLGDGTARITFGKYNGRAIEDIPLSYLRWCLRTATAKGEDTRNEFYDRVRLAIENDIRDTTKERYMTMMPYGIYQERHLDDLPKHYLQWLLEHTNWNVTNDSLRRGVEIALRKERLIDDA